MRSPFRLTVRVRLALVLAALIVLIGVAQQAATYLIASTTTVRYSASGQPILSGLRMEESVAQAIIVVIACGLAWLMAGRMLRPVRLITDAARRITGEDLHERLALGGPTDELTELGDTFDAMLARLEAAFAAQQLFAANAAHELRTPLAVMRAELDLLLTGPQPSPEEVRDAATRLRRTVLRSERLLERLLTLTRGDAHAPGAGTGTA